MGTGDRGVLERTPVLGVGPACSRLPILPIPEDEAQQPGVGGWGCRQIPDPPRQGAYGWGASGSV